MRTMPTTRGRTRRRSTAVRLDPYALDDTTLTLEEWRRLNLPAPPRAGRTSAGPRPKKRAA